MPRLAALALVAFLLSPPSATTIVGEEPPPSLTIEGYADRLSVPVGESVALHVSTTAARFSIEVARLGAETRVVQSRADLPGASRPIPEDASARGCRWPASHALSIPLDWSPGYYQVKLRASDDGGKYVGRGRRTAESDLFFVVRSAGSGPRSPILLQLATNTYNAYTNWGGSSLYAFNGRGGLQGRRVSFDRPLTSQFRQWELPFVAWAERNGYALDYCVNGDLDTVPGLLDGRKLVLSVGHDEYWSAPMRDALEAYIGRGGNVAFLSGNTCCWQVRAEDRGRALACYKQDWSQDPVYPNGDLKTLTTLWSHHLVGRPENSTDRRGLPPTAAITRATASSWTARARSKSIAPTTGSSRGPNLAQERRPLRRPRIRSSATNATAASSS